MVGRSYSRCSLPELSLPATAACLLSESRTIPTTDKRPSQEARAPAANSANTIALPWVTMNLAHESSESKGRLMGHVTRDEAGGLHPGINAANLPGARLRAPEGGRRRPTRSTGETLVSHSCLPGSRTWPG